MSTKEIKKGMSKKSSQLFGLVLGSALGITVLVGATNAMARDWVSSLFCPSGIAAAIESAASLPKLPPEWQTVSKPLNFDHMFPRSESNAK